MNIPLKRTAYGEFPEFEGELLSWSIGLYQTLKEAQAGFPRMRAVIQAALQHGRREMVLREREWLVRGSFDPLFGHNAKVAITVIDEELNR